MAPLSPTITKNQDLILIVNLANLDAYPSYAPECNPDEYLNNAVKQRTRRKKMSRNQEELSRHLRSTLAKLQKEPATIRNLFQAPSVRYAA